MHAALGFRVFGAGLALQFLILMYRNAKKMIQILSWFYFWLHFLF